MIYMWVCVIGGGVGRGGGEEFVFPLIFPFIFFSGVDLPIEGDFPYRDLFSAMQL